MREREKKVSIPCSGYSIFFVHFVEWFWWMKPALAHAVCQVSCYRYRLLKSRYNGYCNDCAQLVIGAFCNDDVRMVKCMSSELCITFIACLWSKWMRFIPFCFIVLLTLYGFAFCFCGKPCLNWIKLAKWNYAIKMPPVFRIYTYFLRGNGTMHKKPCVTHR